MSFNWFETIGLTLDLSFVKTEGVLINSRNCPPMVGSVLRTPISAKYCWFGWWLGAWSTSSHHPTQLCDIYISGYKYILISEWTRLFGLLRILHNLISGAVSYFCTTISVFCEIYTLRMRVVAHAAIVWVGWYFMPSSGAGLVVSVPINSVAVYRIFSLFLCPCRRAGWIKLDNKIKFLSSFNAENWFEKISHTISCYKATV